MTKSPHPSSVDKGELLPCPLCGSKIVFRLGGYFGHPNIPTDCPAQDIVIGHSDQARMIAWNTRRQAHSLPGDVGMCVLLADVELTLQHARIFITTREKMHPHGVVLYDEKIVAVGRALEALAPTTPADLGLTVHDQWKADAALVASPTAIEDGEGYLYEPTDGNGVEQAKAALQSALTALADDSTPIVRRVARTRIRHAIAALTPSALSGDAGEGERSAIVKWLRDQSDKGADIANEKNKGSTARSAYGGGSFALKLAADEIEAGAHIISGIAAKIAAGLTESQNDAALPSQQGTEP